MEECSRNNAHYYYYYVVHLYCSAQLSMLNMEKRYRNKIIIIMTGYAEEVCFLEINLCT